MSVIEAVTTSSLEGLVGATGADGAFGLAFRGLRTACDGSMRRRQQTNRVVRDGIVAEQRDQRRAAGQQRRIGYFAHHSGEADTEAEQAADGKKVVTLENQIVTRPD